MSRSTLQVALRADASPRMGLGHVTRCLSLAQALQQCGASARLVSRDLGIDTSDLARTAGVELDLLPAPAGDCVVAASAPLADWAGVGAMQDAEQTSALLRARSINRVVVDHYAFDAGWHRCVADRSGAQVAVIDDLADRELATDLLIDHNYADDHREKYGLHVDRETEILGGPRFALLAPPYATAPRCEIRHPVESIGIFMGGVDVLNLSAIVLQACRQLAGFTGNVEVVATMANPHLDELNRLCERWPRTQLQVGLPDLAAFFGRHDLQIGAGGGAVWERCCMGAPTIALIAADNQRASVPALARLGALATLPTAGLIEASSLAALVRELLDDTDRRRSLAKTARSLVDGLGARRVALRLAAHTLCVRRATNDDARMLFAWRNDMRTRAVSRDKTELNWERHLQWLHGVLGRRHGHLLVGRIGSADVGVIRFDRQHGAAMEVSLYLDPALHGLGLGRALLRAGERHARDETHDARQMEVVATVLPENAASQRMFASAGYRRVGNDRWSKNI